MCLLWAGLTFHLFNVSDPDTKATVALVCREMTSHSLDGIKRAEVEIIPLVFLGMHGKAQEGLCMAMFCTLACFLLLVCCTNLYVYLILLY